MDPVRQETVRVARRRPSVRVISGIAALAIVGFSVDAFLDGEAILGLVFVALATPWIASVFDCALASSEGVRLRTFLATRTYEWDEVRSIEVSQARGLSSGMYEMRMTNGGSKALFDFAATPTGFADAEAVAARMRQLDGTKQ